MAYTALIARALVGMVFAVSAAAKLRSPAAYRTFASWLAGLPVPLAGRRAVPPVLAGTETAVVVAVAVPVSASAGLVLAALTLVALTAGTAIAVRRGARVSCQCFGPSQAPLAVRHVARNTLLLTAAVAGALTSWPGIAGRARLAPAGVALSLLAAVVAATFVIFLDDLAALVGSDPVVPAGAASTTTGDLS